MLAGLNIIDEFLLYKKHFLGLSKRWGSQPIQIYPTRQRRSIKRRRVIPR